MDDDRVGMPPASRSIACSSDWLRTFDSPTSYLASSWTSLIAPKLYYQQIKPCNFVLSSCLAGGKALCQEMPLMTSRAPCRQLAPQRAASFLQGLPQTTKAPRPMAASHSSPPARGWVRLAAHCPYCLAYEYSHTPEALEEGRGAQYRVHEPALGQSAD